MNYRIACCFVALTSFASIQQSWGFARIWDGNLTFDTSLGVTYDSEISSRNEGREDTIYRLRSGFTYTRSGPSLDLSSAFGITASRYQDNDQFDDDNWYFDLSISPSAEASTDRFRISGDLILDSATRSDEELGEIITTRTYGATGGIIYQANRRTSLSVDLSASREDPQSDRFTEIDQYGASLVLSRQLNRDYAFDVGSEYEKTDPQEESAQSNETLAAFVGLQGQLLPKLNGSVRLGAQQNTGDNQEDQTAPYASASLQWILSETTNASLSLSHNFSTNVGGQTSESTSTMFSIQRQMNERLSASLGLEGSDSSLRFQGLDLRNTETFTVFGSLDYQINEWASIVADIRYSDQSSDDAEFTYDRLQTGLSLTLRW